MKKIKLLILLLILLFTTCGCLNYTELNDIGIIDAIGINKKDKNYTISINMLTPTVKNLEESKKYQVTAETLEEAFDKLYLLTSKDINLSHLELLLLNKNLNKEDFDNITNFFLNRDDSRNTFKVLVVDNYNEEKLFKFKSNDINYLIETNSKEDGMVITKTFDEIVEDILDIQISYIPLIDIDQEIKVLGYQSIYSESKKLDYWESISYNYLYNKIIKCNLVDKDLNIKIDKSRTIMEIDKNKITININSALTNYGKGKNIETIYNGILKKNLTNFLSSNNLNYFKNMIKKYDFNYYKNNRINNIDFKINIKSKLNKGAIKDEK